MAKKAGQTKGQAEEQLSKKDEAEIKNLFKMFTKGKSEYITERDLKMGLRVACKGNPTEKEIAQIYEDLDIKRGDKISYAKFHQMMANYIQRSKDKTPEEKLKDMKAAFKVFDKNGDGKIDKTELINFLKNTGDTLSDTEAEEMFKLVDANKDGKIDSNEFVDLLCGNIK